MTETASSPDLAAAGQWLIDNVPGLEPPLRFRPVYGGHSNITTRVSGRTRTVALRRPPYGALPRGAHDVVGEARTVAALAGSGVPVPEVLAICTDDAVIGAPFAITAWIDGTVVASPEQVAPVLPRPLDRQRVADEMITTLATLHRADPALIGTEPRAASYLERQLGRLGETWSAIKTRELPQVTELADRLLDARPRQPRTGIVHADFRLGNCMLSADGHLLAVLDWELAARGDVLADLAYLLNNWESADEPGAPVWMQTPPTRAGGFPDRAALVGRYQELTGFDTDAISYYQGFAAWRMAVIAEGVKHRYESGALADAGVDHGYLERRVRDLLVHCDRHLRTSGA